MSGGTSSISTCRPPLQVGTRRDVGCSHTSRYSIELSEVPPRLNKYDRRAKRRSFVSGVTGRHTPDSSFCSLSTLKKQGTNSGLRRWREKGRNKMQSLPPELKL